MKGLTNMSEPKIITREINNAKYVIEIVKSYRNKEGKPRNKQRSLGRLDEDGVLITNKRKLPAQIKKVRRITTKFIFEDFEGKKDKENNENKENKKEKKNKKDSKKQKDNKDNKD